MANKSMLYSLKVGAFVARVIPRTTGMKLLGGVGYLFGLFPTKIQKRLFKIHKTISPQITRSQLRRRAAQVVGSYAQYWWDVFWMSSTRSKEEIESIVSVEGFSTSKAAIKTAVDNKVGVIFALPHLGSWEIAGAWVAQQGFPPVVVAERLEPPELFEMFTTTRTKAGMTVIAHDDRPTAKLIEALKDQKVVCLVADRDIKRKGIKAKFFTKEKTFPAGPAALAKKTGAPILPVCTYISHDCRVNIVFNGAIEPHLYSGQNAVEDMTKDLAAHFEDMVAKDPSQWHVLYDEWE